MKRKIVVEIDALARRCGKCDYITTFNGSAWCHQYQQSPGHKYLRMDIHGKPQRCAKCLAAEREAKS